jgi:hypothetical protein
MEKQRKLETSIDAKGFIEHEIYKRREWSSLKRGDQQENLVFNLK